jgi:hypothetical protein
MIQQSSLPETLKASIQKSKHHTQTRKKRKHLGTHDTTDTTTTLFTHLANEVFQKRERRLETVKGVTIGHQDLASVSCYLRACKACDRRWQFPTNVPQRLPSP